MMKNWILDKSELDLQLCQICQFLERVRNVTRDYIPSKIPTYKQEYGCMLFRVNVSEREYILDVKEIWSFENQK